MNACVFLKGKPELLAAVARFNAPEIGDFDPDALPAQAAALLRAGTLRKLEAGRAGKAMLRAWLFRQLGAKGAFTDFSEERRRLALLGKDTLSGLALAYGACIYAEDAARLVKREDVMKLRALLGAHYEYALSRGRFQVRQAGDFFASFMSGAPLPERMAEAGFAALRLCLADWPDELLRRAAPRMPAALRLPADTGAASRPIADSRRYASMLPVFWADLKKLLLTQVEPRWQPCFA